MSQQQHQASAVIDLHDLPGGAKAHSFLGAEHDGIPVSFFLVHSTPGAGPELHRHPYPEVFVVHAGRVRFQLGDDELEAQGGQIVVAPAGVPHRLTNVGSDQLRLTAIHPVSEISTEWLA